MNKFEAEALKRWPKSPYNRAYFKRGCKFGYTAGLEDAGRAIDRAQEMGWVRRGDYWILTDMSEVYRFSTTAALIEKYKTE